MTTDDEFRARQYEKIITGFVTAYADLNPDVISVPDAIDWFILHHTRLQQAETPEMRETVKRLVTEQVDYSQGVGYGEAWARATGTTSGDLRMVPVVAGTDMYKSGHRVGVGKVRRERYLAENGIPDDSNKPLFDCRKASDVPES